MDWEAEGLLRKLERDLRDHNKLFLTEANGLANGDNDLRLAWDRFLLLQVRVYSLLFMGAQLSKCPIACAADGRAMWQKFDAIGNRRGVIRRVHLPQNRASSLVHSCVSSF